MAFAESRAPRVLKHDFHMILTRFNLPYIRRPGSEKTLNEKTLNAVRIRGLIVLIPNNLLF